MELDEFLEKDIIHFLEERKEKKIIKSNLDREEDYGLYLTKDYLKEITSALEKDEITLAQKLFDELKMHYDTLPKTSLESKKVYSILEQSYSKINTYNQLKGNGQSIKSFDDVLGKGFQGSIPQKIHQTTTKIDKKIDNIDEKLTTFGKDVKELKHTLLESSIPSTMVAKGQTIYLKDSKINILPPNVPKIADIADAKKTIDSKSADIKNNAHILEENKFSHTNLQSPHVKKKDNKKGIRLYKVPKFDKKKKHNTIPEHIFNKKAKNEQKNQKNEELTLPGVTDTHSVFKIPPGKKPEKNSADMSVNNMILPSIKMPSHLETEQMPKKEQVPVDLGAEKFDSPFQESKQIITSKESDVTFKKSIPDKFPTNEYEKLYSDALREFSLRNYDAASKLFMKVLEIKPTHKASIIRLKQCEEAMHNA